MGSVPESCPLPGYVKSRAGDELSPDSLAHMWMAAHLVDEFHEGLGTQLLYPLLLEAGQVVPLRLPLRLAAGVEGGVLGGRLRVSPRDAGALPACAWRSSPPRWP